MSMEQVLGGDVHGLERSVTQESISWNVSKLSMSEKEEQEEKRVKLAVEEERAETLLCEFHADASMEMLQKYAVRSLKVTSSIPSNTFVKKFLQTKQVTDAARKVKAHPYVASLAQLCEQEGRQLAITSTTYELANPSHKIELFDIKCRARFEDDIIEKICRDWPAKNGTKFGPVCPLRRGICIGLINDEHLILAVGNSKFFYGEEDDIVKTGERVNEATVLLSEKANGEYTMLSSTLVPMQNQTVRWLTVGSKNVRLCLPFFPDDVSMTRRVFDQIVFAFSNNNINKEEGHRFSYMKDMMELWLKGLTSQGTRMFDELDSGTTLVGEQVGVHAHIFTGYKMPHIRLFASLQFERLNTEMGCSLKQLNERLFGGSVSKEEKPLMLVGFEEYSLPSQRQELLDGLDRISSGSMDVYGEGVVVYVYDASNDACLDLFKFKCQEYAFDRRLRTVLSRPAGELQRGGMTRLKLKEECTRVETEMKKAMTQFSKMNRERGLDRIAMVPAMFAFLDRHQATIYCSDFSDNFVDFMQAVRARRDEYNKLAQSMFMQVFDSLQDSFAEFLGRFEGIFIPVRTVEDLAKEIYTTYEAKGGRDKFNCIGIAAMPGGGKTAILRALERLLQSLNVPCKLCDRDSYVIADPGARGDVIHKLWTEDIHDTALRENKVVLVGNTFTGTFADKLEQQTKTRVFLCTLKEATVVHSKKNLVMVKQQQRDGTCSVEDVSRCRATLFNLACLRRLFDRRETHADGSTLTMGLGTRVVLEKFFASQPDEKMMERRLKQGSACLIECIPQTSFNYKETVELADAIVKFKQQVLSPIAKEAAPEEEKIHRTSYVKSTVDYVAKSLQVDTSSSVLSRIRFAGLAAEPSCAKQLLSMADADLLRTDCHSTVTFQPNESEVRTFIRNFEAFENLSFPLMALVTVKKENKKRSHKLQFLVLGVSPTVDKFMSPAAHVTLGSSNPDALPHSTSGLVLQELLDNKVVSKKDKTLTPSGPIQLNDGLEATISPLPADCLFVGVPCFFSVGKSLMT